MKIIKILVGLSASLVMLAFSNAQAGPVDLSTWSVEEYSAGSGNWTVAGDKASVTQSINNDPTFFISDFNSQGSEFKGSIKVNTTSDDDYLGFALGINSGDASTPNPAADYLLIDWKQGDQEFNFDGTSTLGKAGLAVSRVTGAPNRDEFWGHTDVVSDGSGAVQELQRATNLGSTGWSDLTSYEFTFDFGPNNLNVYVDSVLELSILGSFDDGRFGFYNFSLADVTYSGFTEDVGSFPSAVPVPAAVWLFGTALIGFVGISRRRKVA
jgi:hypothetical protein